jgi:hypothetical protein
MRFQVQVVALLFLAMIFWIPVCAQDSPPSGSDETDVASIEPAELEGYEAYPVETKALIEKALGLTRRQLGYRYGSCDPKQGGMDCSGTIHYLLKSEGFEHVPRQANEIYKWVWKGTRFWAVVSSREDSFEFSELRPGDLLFWSGTYQVDRDPPVTHVMLYLGRSVKTGKRLMFGASERRRYQGQSKNGVSVFDFEIPKANGQGARFLGYGAPPAK